MRAALGSSTEDDWRNWEKEARAAIDEIERLSALESRPVALADAIPKDTAKDSELAEARAEIERLRSALGPFAFAADEVVRPHHEDGWCITVGIPAWVLRRARTVLSREKEASSNE